MHDYSRGRKKSTNTLTHPITSTLRTVLKGTLPQGLEFRKPGVSRRKTGDEAPHCRHVASHCAESTISTCGRTYRHDQFMCTYISGAFPMKFCCKTIPFPFSGARCLLFFNLSDFIERAFWGLRLWTCLPSLVFQGLDRRKRSDHATRSD